MINHILYALAHSNKLVPIERHHLSNFAVNSVFPSELLRLLGNSYEDNNIGSITEAVDVANLISTIIPNEWVLIDTGDYISSKNGFTSREYDEETYDPYDPYYCYYLVRKETFDRMKEEVFEVDRKWREEKQKIANGEIKPE